MASLLPEFRPIGGSDNNLTNPALNAIPGTAELNIAPLNSNSVDGPNARTVSNLVSTQADGVVVADEKLSGMVYVWGQFQDHDISLKQSGTEDISIAVPAGDPDLPDGTVIPLTRAAVDPVAGTEINTVSAYLDLSQVYGSDAEKAAGLRNADGTMKTSDGNALSLVNGQFVAGDVRVMENPDLIAITTLWVREHNTQVAKLAAEHPEWTGDQLYDMARAITTAEYQNITYKEFVPALIGDTVGKYHGYNPAVNSQVTQEFSVGAFRVGHSQVSDEQIGMDNDGNETFSQPLAEAFLNTPAQTLANGVDELLRHVPADDSQAVDVLAVNGLRNLLVAPPNAIDLIATDIQRTRDAGLGTLNETRVALGLDPYKSFAQLTHDTTVQNALKQAYGSIDKVDLFIGGLAEAHAKGGGVVGSTFQAIIADQYSRLRDGDRFFWQNQPFDAETKKAIAATTLSDVMERNTNTAVIQQNVFTSTARHLSNVSAEEPDAPQLVIGVDDAGAVIAGGRADDTIVAGLGVNQKLTGGGGHDVFVIDGTAHTATITDFNARSSKSIDRIEFQGAASNSTVTIQDMKGAAGCVVMFNGNTIMLDGVKNGHNLTADNFVLSPGVTAHLDYVKAS